MSESVNPFRRSVDEAREELKARQEHESDSDISVENVEDFSEVVPVQDESLASDADVYETRFLEADSDIPTNP